MRMLPSLVVGALILATLPIASAEIVTDGLTNRWKIDEGSGTTTVDSVGTADGTFVNGPTWTTDTPGPNHPPYALDFEKDNLDHLHFANDSVPTGAAGTIDAWFKVESWSTWRATLFIKGPSAAWANMYLALLANDAQNGLMMSLSNGSSSTTSNLSTGPIPLNRWTHVAGTWDGANEYVYLNGVLVDSDSFGIVPANTAGYKVDIAYGNYQDRYFDGIIDEVRLYDRALTPEEVLQNFHAIVPEPASVLLMVGALGCLLFRRRRRRR